MSFVGDRVIDSGCSIFVSPPKSPLRLTMRFLYYLITDINHSAPAVAPQTLVSTIGSFISFDRFPPLLVFSGLIKYTEGDTSVPVIEPFLPFIV